VLSLAPDTQAKIVVGQGIAGVRLGESEAQVQKALGTPAYKTQEGKDSSWGYPKAPLEGRIGFDQYGRVNGMWTGSRHQKTSKGIGPGSSLAQLHKVYPTAKCSTGPFGPKSVICALKSKYHGRTVETSFPFFYRNAGMREVDIGFS